jgi:hypothetical protein
MNTSEERRAANKALAEAAAAANLPPPPDPEDVALRMQGAQVVLEPDSPARAGAMGVYPDLEQNRVLRDAGYIQMGLNPRDPSNELTDPPVPPEGVVPPEGGNGEGGEGEATEAPINVDVPLAQQEGQVLTCTMGNWEGMQAEPHSYAYAWTIDGADAGSTAEVNIVPEDVGKQAVCVVTATNAIGSTAAPPSNAVTVA